VVLLCEVSLLKAATHAYKLTFNGVSPSSNSSLGAAFSGDACIIVVWLDGLVVVSDGLREFFILSDVRLDSHEHVCLKHNLYVHMNMHILFKLTQQSTNQASRQAHRQAHRRQKDRTEQACMTADRQARWNSCAV
jgi:hypothetical protein